MTDQVPFDTILAALLDDEHIFPAGYLHHFSDLETEQLQQLEMVWPQIQLTRKQRLLEDLEELSIRETLFSFDNMAINLLTDDDPIIRMMAIRLLWECENSKLIPIFLEILKNDTSPLTRAAAASGLGAFVYMGELDKIPSSTLKLIEDELIRAASEGSDDLVKRKAIESLGFSSRSEVDQLVSAEIASNQPERIASAIIAIGRSNNPAWEEEVLEGIQQDNDLIRLEAIQAAGNLNLGNSRSLLLEVLDDLNDQEIIKAALWSLSQIGGEGVRDRIEEIEHFVDPEEDQFMDEVMENLNLTEEMASFDFFEIDPDPDLSSEVDLSDLE
ncbi:HEAT repeat domain-containing protein [Chloroflexota bacterium]